ncbi:hypothetical protein [Streptomyces ipomoeae]|uniref:hypothetical protein n=1 Tax=Streptomyces ipomoeae TaxID=103232 RepID=UPI00114760B1|nr:hypothetical protein [Streptomyces ipomoeae]TQE33169.1 hypothetical protein Sipo7851_22005 [Streptomyces ipomoeae]
MARDIGMEPDAALYRAVITKSYAAGTEFTVYEGPYAEPGPARARVTFWRNHFAKRDNGDKADGHVETCKPAWEPMGEATEAALPHPWKDATSTDDLGRPVCDGTQHRGTRNCPRTADFQLLHPDTKAVAGYACGAHLGQVTSTVNGGEKGTLLTRQISTQE